MNKGWRAFGLSLIAGASAALAMPPLYWLPLAIAGLVVFVWQWDHAATPRAALMRGGDELLARNRHEHQRPPRWQIGTHLRHRQFPR